MNNKDYWNKRAVYNQIFAAKRMKKVENFQVELFKELIDSLNKELAYWYSKFSLNGALSSIDSRKQLTRDDHKELDRYIKNNIKMSKNNGIKPIEVSNIEKLLNRARINRLEAMKAIIEGLLLEVFSKVEGNLRDEIISTYREIESRTIYEVAKGYNQAIKWNVISTGRINTILNTPWTLDSKTFNTHIWENKTKLLNALELDLKAGFILGSPIRVITKKMAERVYRDKNYKGNLLGGSIEYQMRRIAYTEIAYFSEKARYDIYKELGSERYQIDSTLDTNTCSICRGKDGEVYDMNDYIVGETAPVFHPFCRCTTVPYFPKDFEGSERFARNKSGKPIYVPRSIKYKEYYDKYIKEGA